MRLVSLAIAGALLASCAATIREQIYLPAPMPASIAWADRAPREVIASMGDGLTLRGYFWSPPAAGGDVIVYFHGQSGNRYAAARAAAPLAAGGGLLVASYRGYGDNPGTPDEAGLYADARAFVALARTLAPGSRIYLIGFSLGAAPTLHVAAESEVAGVVTIGAFTELADAAPSYARGFLPDRFDNRAAIKRVTAPILILHGTADEVVPISHAEELKAVAPRARFLRLEGAGHAIDFGFLAPIIWDNIRQMPR